MCCDKSNILPEVASLHDLRLQHKAEKLTMRLIFDRTVWLHMFTNLRGNPRLVLN